MDSENESCSYPSGYDSPYPPSSSQNSTEDDVDDVFYFESDHVALKGNKDYQNMLRAICRLEAQRTQATNDLEHLLECEKAALEDPIKFVEKLQNRVDMGFPESLQVVQLPHVQWEKYTSSVDPMNLAVRKHMTRKQKGGSEGRAPGETGTTGTQDISFIKQEFPGSIIATDPSTSSPQIVRGRVKDETKTVTFNKLWTVEEQRHLEELLVEHGPEPVEVRRWAKIAEALGNRTTQQVASRVQKYFIRLAKAGLPIPGRMPNLNAHMKKGAHRHQRYNRMYFQPSTFLQSHQPQVYMPDGDDDEGMCSMPRNTMHDAMEEVSDEDDVPPEKRLTVEYQELMHLKRLRQVRIAKQCTNQHTGYKCDQCGCEPIVGTRWHCTVCPDQASVDFCDECMDCQFDNGTHQPHHRLEPLEPGGADSGERIRFDQDYLQGSQQQGNYNYLDPNYMPAS